MKKFLTVLLVIAVMFTFSFGSAFALSDADKANVVDKATALTYAQTAYENAQKALVNQAKEAVKAVGTFDSVTGSLTAYGVTASKEAYEAALANVTGYKTLLEEIETEYTNTIQAINTAAAGKDFAGFVKGNATEVVEAGAYYGLANAKYTFNAPDVTTLDTTGFGTAFAKAAFKEVKSATLDAIASIDLSVYSKEYNKQTESNYDKATDFVQTAINAINAVAAPSSHADVAAQVKEITDIYTPAKGEAKASGTLAVNLAGIEKMEDAEENAADLAYAQKKVLNALLAELSEEMNRAVDTYQGLIRVEKDLDKPDAEDIAEWTEAIADVEAAYEDAVAAITYLVQETETVSELGSFVNGVFQINTSKWDINGENRQATTYNIFKTINVRLNTTTAGKNVANVLNVAAMMDMAEEVAKAEKLAANDRVYINLDGSYAVQIDEALAKAINAIYTEGDSAAEAYKTPTNTGELAARKEALIEDGNVIIDNKKYEAAVEDWSDFANAADVTYDADLNDEIRAIVKETKAAIKAAASIAAADAAYVEGVDKIDALVTAAEHRNMFTLKNGALTEKFDKYQAQFNAYVEAKEDVIESLLKTTDYDYTKQTLKDYFAAEWTGAFYAGVYDEAALDAAYAEAIAVVDGLKTKTEMKAMADAAAAVINALPATVTVADKAAVEAAREAYGEYEDYVDMIGAADKFETEGAYVRVMNKLAAAEDTIKKAERKAIADIVKVLPTSTAKVTLADAENVDAIRTLADAYVESYVAKDATNEAIDALYAEALNGFNLVGYEGAVALAEVAAVQDMISKLAVDDVDAEAVRAARAALAALPEGYGVTKAHYDKLVALEKILAVDVEAVKVTARSSAKKGSITVKWSVDGNESAVEAYEIWRSTKKNSGFKKMFTTEKMSYKNSKNLKKGTRYYYKVRAIAYVDDVKVKSDWSNKAYRVAK